MLGSTLAIKIPMVCYMINGPNVTNVPLPADLTDSDIANLTRHIIAIQSKETHREH
jgi:hypothetical protein